MRFRLVETITQNNKIYKKIQEIISNEYNGKKYEDLSDSDKRKVVDKAIEEFDTRNVLKPSKTVYTNELLEHGIDERENPFVTFMENIKVALPTTIIKVLIDKTHKGYGEYRIDPRRDDFIYDKRLYNKMDSTGDIKDTIYKLNALAYVNNEKVEKDGKRIIVDDLIGKSIERIKNILNGIQVEESKEYNMLEAIIKYLSSNNNQNSKELADTIAKNKKEIENYKKDQRIILLDKIVEIIGKENLEKKIPNYDKAIEELKKSEKIWEAFLKTGINNIEPKEFLNNLEIVLKQVNQQELKKPLIDFITELQGEKDLDEFILVDVLPKNQEYENLSEETKKVYKERLNKALTDYSYVYNNKGNTEKTDLGKLFREKGITKDQISQKIFEWLKGLVERDGLLNNTSNKQDITPTDNKGTRVYRMQKPNFDYNGDSI